MQKLLLRIFLTLISIGAFHWQSANADTDSKSNLVAALKLTQTHFYWGDSETIVSEQGLRINNLGKMHFSLVASSPNWDVTVFRDDDKTYLRQSLKQFLLSGLISDFVVSRQPQSIGAGAPVTNVKIGDSTVKEIKLVKDIYQYLPVKNLAPAIENILYATFKTPTNGGLPIKVTKRQRGRDWLTGLQRTDSQKVLLNTKEIKHVMVNKSIFEAPRGYQPRHSMQEVLMSKANRDAAGDMDEIFDANSGKTERAKTK